MNVLYGLSILGRVTRVDLDPGYLWSVAPTTGRLDADAERMLYCRDLDGIHECLSSQLPSVVANRDDGVAVVEELDRRMFPPSLHSERAWTVAGQCDAELFDADLQQRRVGFPVAFGESPLVTSDNHLKEVLHRIKLKVNLLRWLHLGETLQLTSLLNSMDAGLVPEVLSPKVLYGVIGKVYGQHGAGRIDALDLAIKLLPFYGARLDGDGCRIVYLLLFPTVFDQRMTDLLSDSCYLQPPVDGTKSVQVASMRSRFEKFTFHSPPAPAAQPNVELRVDHPPGLYDNAPLVVGAIDIPLECQRLIQDTQTALAMLGLEKDMAALQSASDREAAVLSMHRRDRKVSLSADLNWTLLVSFLNAGMLDEYFQTGLNMAKMYPASSPFMGAVTLHRDIVGVERIRLVIRQAVGSHRPTMLLRCLLTIVRLVRGFADASQRLSNALDLLLVDGIQTVQRSLRMAECTKFTGYQELRMLVSQLSPKDGLLRASASSELVKELGLLKSRLK